MGSKKIKKQKQWSNAFTLAEVLITLGVIGVVAAMTMPTLIQNYRKHVVETRLEKFYSMINQAIQMSETVNGDRKYWDSLQITYETNEEGEPDYSKPQALAWFEKYLKPYIKYTKYDIINSDTTYGLVVVYLEDGSILTFNSSAWRFIPNGQKFKLIENENGTKAQYISGKLGVEVFEFFFNPNINTTSYKYHYNKGVEPYAWGWDGNRDSLLTTPAGYGCTENGGAYCTKLIQLNGWKIPKDYPLKF